MSGFIRNILLHAINIFLFQNISDAQLSFAHAAGFTYFSYKKVNQIGISYLPRINFINFKGEQSISLSTGMSFGYAWYVLDPPASSYAYNLPLTLDFNIGHGSSALTKSESGYYFGLGGFLNELLSTEKFKKQYQEQDIGLLFNTGIRFKNDRHNFNVYFSYGYALNEKENREYYNVIIGLGCSYMYGRMLYKRRTRARPKFI